MSQEKIMRKQDPFRYHSGKIYHILMFIIARKYLQFIFKRKLHNVQNELLMEYNI